MKTRLLEAELHVPLQKNLGVYMHVSQQCTMYVYLLSMPNVKSVLNSKNRLKYAIGQFVVFFAFRATEFLNTFDIFVNVLFHKC